jgi:hypothetical protein
MSQRSGSKSLAEQQEAFKKGLLNQSKIISSIADSRSNDSIKNRAYGIVFSMLQVFLVLDHLLPTVAEGKIHINTEIYRLIQFLKVFLGY